MKVNLEYESIDMDGEKHISSVLAIMEIRDTDYRLVFVEDLSGEGKMTRSTMYLSSDSVRIIREGELKTDFMFARDLVHNTGYATPYGLLPVTLTTKAFDFSVSHPDFKEKNALRSESFPKDFLLSAFVEYDIEMSGQSMPMRIKVVVTGIS